MPFYVTKIGYQTIKDAWLHNAAQYDGLPGEHLSPVRPT